MVGSAKVDRGLGVGHGLDITTHPHPRGSQPGAGVWMRRVEPDRLIEVADRQVGRVLRSGKAPPSGPASRADRAGATEPGSRPRWRRRSRSSRSRASRRNVVDLGRRLPPRQQCVAGTDGDVVTFQPQKRPDPQQLGVGVVRDNGQGRVTSRQCLLVVVLVEEQQSPVGLVAGHDGVARRLQADRLVEVGEGPARVGPGSIPCG